MSTTGRRATECVQANPSLCASICCILLITSCALFGASFSIVRPNYVGILYNRNVLHIETDELYPSGRYMAGIGRKFLSFPTTYQTIRMGSEFGELADAGDIVCRTSEGLVMRVEVSFQYRLNITIEDLVRVYLDTADQYHIVYTDMAQAAIRDACSLYTATEFIENRTELAEAMHEFTNARLERLYASIPTFELVNMEFDQAFAYAIEQTQIAKQDVLLAENQYSVAEVDSERRIAEAQTVAQITVRDAYAFNVSLAAAAQAEAELFAIRIREQTLGFKTLREELGLNTSQALLGYHYFAVLDELSMTKGAVGLNFPKVIRDTIGL